MREHAVNVIIQLLNDNQGNKLTASLSVGIASLLNQELLRYETANATQAAPNATQAAPAE
jgi:hypothetical protein